MTSSQFSYKHILFSSLLVLGCFFVVQQTKAVKTGWYESSVQCTRHGVSDSTSCPPDGSGNPNIGLSDTYNDQAFEMELTYANGHGHGITSKWKIIGCLTVTGAMWQGPCFIEGQDDYPYDDGQPRSLPIDDGQVGIGSNDTADYNGAVLNVYVMDMEVDVGFRMRGRRPSLDAQVNPSGSVNVGQGIEVSWSGYEINHPVTLTWDVPGWGSGSHPFNTSDSSTFYPDAPGIAYFTVQAQGPGGHGMETITQNFQVTINGSMTGDIQANPMVCAEPCDIDLTYTTSGATTARIKKNGVNWRDITSNVGGGLQEDNGVGENYYTYSLYGYYPGWTTETLLDEVTVRVDPGSSGGGATLVCNPASQNVQTGSMANFNAQGGVGANYNWSAPGGSQTSGSQATFSTSYSSSGTKTVTLTRGAETKTCSVNVTDAPVILSCNPSSQSVNINTNATINASGGTGSFSWSAPGGSPSSAGNVGSFSTSYPTSGTKTVTVTRGSETRTCNVNVNGAPPSNISPVGSFDFASCNQGLNGWAYDPNSLNVPIQVHVYRDAAIWVGAYTAGNARPDIAAATGDAGTHGFSIPMPLFDGVTHTYFIYGIDTSGVGNAELSYSPKTATCGTPAINCGEVYTLANTPYGVGDAARNGAGAYNPNYWLADPYQAGTTAANFNPATNKIGLSMQGGINYPAGMSKGLAINPPPGGKIRAINFDYHTFNYNSNIARMSIDIPGQADFWWFSGTGNHDSRSGSQTPGDNTQTVVFPGSGADAAFLLIYQQSGITAPTVAYDDFYINSITMDRPCNPSLTITGPSTVTQGSSASISWSAVDVTEGSVAVTFSPAINSSDPDVNNAWTGSGSFTDTPVAPSRTYTITATRADTGAAISASHTVNVSTGGTLNINCAGPAGAQWQVRTVDYSGTIVGTGSPSSSTHSLPATTYFITFTPVAGYATPAQRSAVVNASAITTVSGCDYGVNQGTLNVNSFGPDGTTTLNSSWTITNPGSIAHNNVSTSTNSLAASPYTVTPASLGCTYTTPAVQNPTVSNGQTSIVNFSYLRGTLRINSNISSGSWTISPCGPGSGSGTTPVNYPLATGVQYTITPGAVPGYTASPIVVSPLNNNETRAVVVAYTITPLNPPTITSVTNTTCQQITVNWTDNSNNELGFEVWRSDNPTSGFVNLTPYPGSHRPANSTSYTDTTGTVNSYYYYRVNAVNNVPFNPNRSTPSASVGPTLNKECKPDIIIIKNILNILPGPSHTSVDSYSSATTINDGDVLRFEITISNTGSSAGTITSILDTLTDNLVQPPTGNVSNPWNLQIDRDANWGTTLANEVGFMTGTAPNLAINANGGWGSKPVGNPNWVIRFDALVQSQLPNGFEAVSNSACINYTWATGTGTNCDKEGPILIRTGSARVPRFREVTP